MENKNITSMASKSTGSTVNENFKCGPGGLYDPLKSQLVRVEQQTDTEMFFEIRLPDGLSLDHQNGQFVEVSVFGLGEAPISICSPSTQKDTFELVVRATGKVTDHLHSLKPGDFVGIRGPMGRGFDMDSWKGKDLLIIGGGIGLVPLRSIIKTALTRRNDYRKIVTLYGTRNSGEILFKNEIKEWKQRDDMTFDITLDNGSEDWKGKVGLITTLIPPLDIDAKNTIAIITGPPIMYKFVIEELKKKGLTEENIIVSLERMMKCGVGKCGHCAINQSYCCIEGPVYTLSECKGLAEAL